VEHCNTATKGAFFALAHRPTAPSYLLWLRLLAALTGLRLLRARRAAFSYSTHVFVPRWRCALRLACRHRGSRERFGILRPAYTLVLSAAFSHHNFFFAPTVFIPSCNSGLFQPNGSASCLTSFFPFSICFACLLCHSCSKPLSPSTNPSLTSCIPASCSLLMAAFLQACLQAPYTPLNFSSSLAFCLAGYSGLLC